MPKEAITYIIFGIIAPIIGIIFYAIYDYKEKHPTVNFDEYKNDKLH